MTTWVRSTASATWKSTAMLAGDSARSGLRPCSAPRNATTSFDRLAEVDRPRDGAGWVGRALLDGVRRAVNRPPPPRRFDVFIVLAIVVVVLWLLPFVVPFVRDMLE